MADQKEDTIAVVVTRTVRGQNGSETIDVRAFSDRETAEAWVHENSRPFAEGQRRHRIHEKEIIEEV
jgi:hypothetical protein